MRKTIPVLAVLGLALAAGGGSLSAQDDEDEDAAEQAKLAKVALEKAVVRGNELFRSKELGKKTCASCHENPDKANLDLKTRSFSYPAWSNKKKAIVTLQQKINEMCTGKSGGQALDPNGTDIAAIEAYIVSLKKR